MEPGREIVHLQGKVRHAVHHICLLWIWCLPPDHLYLALARQDLLQIYFSVPVASDKHARISLLLLAVGLITDFTFDLGDVLILAKPAARVEVDNCLLRATSLVNRHRFSNVNVRRANDEVVEGHERELNFIPLTEV